MAVGPPLILCMPWIARRVAQRHNEVRDALGDIAALAYREVVREPVVREADEAREIPALGVDLDVRA